MVVHEVADYEAFTRLVAQSESKLVAVDFYALWCRPCQQISPHFEEVSKKYSQAVFVRVNVDTCER